MHTATCRRAGKDSLACIGTVALMVLTISCAPNQPPRHSDSHPSYWPTTDWQKASPESQGLSSADLSQFLSSIRFRGLPVHSFLLIRNGYLLVDANFFPYDGASVHDVASVTKSVMSLLIGIAIQQGFIQSVDDHISKYLLQYSTLFDATEKGKITIRNLLTMTSGLKDTPLGSSPIPEALLLETMQQEDWGHYILSLPLEHPRGSHFSYNSAHYHLLSLVLRAATGIDPLVFAIQRLFAPLGIKELRWPKDPQGNPHGWGDLKLFPADMAKIGFLCLNNGIWDGKRILPKGWIEALFTSYIRATEGYGYGWWVPSGAAGGPFEANGRGGQHILIWPRKNIVAVFTGGGFDIGQLSSALMGILNHTDSIPENGIENSLLQETIKSLTTDEDRETASLLPKTAFKVSGTSWRFAPNLFGLKSLSLSFLSDQRAYAQITIDGPGESSNWLERQIRLQQVGQGGFADSSERKVVWDRYISPGD